MNITLAGTEQLQEIFLIYQKCKLMLEAENIFQWTAAYPGLEVIENDINHQNLYVLASAHCLGAITLNTVQEKEYASVNWQYNGGKVLVVHRLAIDPLYQGQGMAGRLMDFAEKYAVLNHYAAIRLDAYSKNSRSLNFYAHSGYEKRGEVYFGGRADPFFCYEKILKIA